MIVFLINNRKNINKYLTLSKEVTSISRKPNKTVFKGMRIVYAIYAILALIFCALVLFVPSISEAFEKAISDASISIGDISVKNFLIISLDPSVEPSFTRIISNSFFVWLINESTHLLIYFSAL